MPATSRLYPPDDLNRKVLFAVELFDPVEQTLISRRVRIAAAGLKRPPIVNRSGRFVWLFEDDAWPTAISVTSDDLRFESRTAPAPPRPNDLAQATEKERLLRIALQPTRIYDFGEGVTALRGALAESLARDAPPITDAKVGLSWADVAGNWQPPAANVATDEHGQFAVFLRLPRLPKPDLKGGLLRVRLQVERPNLVKVTHTFAFLEGPNDPKDRVPEGLLLYRDVRLGWAEL